MSGRRFNTGRDALDFIDGLRTLEQPTQILEALRIKLASFGYHAFLITGLPECGEEISPLVMLNGWPEGWFDLYLQRSFADCDPIAAHCRDTVGAFVWSDVYDDARATNRQREVMQRARDFSMVHGFCVPIHNADGFQAVVTMAGDRPDQTRESRAAIQLMSIYAHGKASACRRKPSRRPRLSPREREVLTWFSLGHSTQGVADVLGLDGTTVQDYFKSAARKLSVRGRTHAVVEAIRLGEVSI